VRDKAVGDRREENEGQKRMKGGIKEMEGRESSRQMKRGVSYKAHSNK
jgi:hypothetical protein